MRGLQTACVVVQSAVTTFFGVAVMPGVHMPEWVLIAVGALGTLVGTVSRSLFPGLVATAPAAPQPEAPAKEAK